MDFEMNESIVNKFFDKVDELISAQNDTTVEVANLRGDLKVLDEKLVRKSEQKNINASIIEHKKDCIMQTTGNPSPIGVKVPGPSPVGVIKLAPETRSLIIKLALIAGAFATGMGGKEIVANLFGG